MEAVVLHVDKDNDRISLGIKQLQPRSLEVGPATLSGGRR